MRYFQLFFLSKFLINYFSRMRVMWFLSIHLFDQKIYKFVLMDRGYKLYILYNFDNIIIVIIISLHVLFDNHHH